MIGDMVQYGAMPQRSMNDIFFDSTLDKLMHWSHRSIPAFMSPLSILYSKTKKSAFEEKRAIMVNSEFCNSSTS